MHARPRVQLSAFNVYVDRFPEEGQTLVYNTFSGGSAVLDSGWLARARSAGCPGSFQVGGDKAADPALAEPDLGILVESRAAEEAEFAGWLRRLKADTRTVSALVSTSYACNLACTYCFQEAVMSGRTMSPETADATARFLADRVRQVGAERLELTFIGGEPLLHPHLIERISRALLDACAAAGAQYSFQIVTNGTLLTRDVARRLVAVGLSVVQVTVDGDECSHGITRVDKRGRNTFQATWRNLLACIDLVPISLQGNYTEANLHGFLPLLERLRRDGVDPARVPRIKFKPALRTIGTPGDAGIDSCTWSDARPELQLALGDAVRAFGYQTHDQLDIGPCAIHQFNHFSIGPEGLIYKCPGFVGKPAWATGSVAGGLDDRHRELTARANTGDCGGCTFRPTCAGGCIATRWIAAGAPQGVNCERGYFDRVGLEVLKRNYFFDTLDQAEAVAAVAALPGHLDLPRRHLELARPHPAAAPLTQIRSPERANAMEIRT